MEGMTKLLSKSLSLCGVVALLLGASIGSVLHPARTLAAPAAANSKTLIVARTLDDMKTLDPGRMYEFSSSAAGVNMYETLVQYHGQNVGKVLPFLATSWKITQGGKVFTFQLRHDVKFSTGRKMTAADVVFSYRRMAYLKDQPAFLMGYSGDVTKVYSITALNKYAVRFVLPAPDVSFLAQLTDVNFAVLDSKAAIAQGADDSVDASTKDRATAWLNEHSIATGPFKLSGWVRGAAGNITLVANKYYWGKKPSLSKIVFQGVESAATQRLEVERGTIDIAQSIDIDGVKALKNNKSVKIVHGNALDLLYMGMTLNPDISKPMSNPLVRQAVRHAIDYKGIIHGLLSDVGTQPNGMIPVGLIGNDAKTNAKLIPKYDKTLAKNLLKQAGYPNGFSVDLYYGVGHVFDGISMDLVMPKVQQDLQAVGINANLKPEDFTVMLAAYRAQKLPMIAIEWGVDYPDSNDFAGPFSPGGGPATRMWYTNDANLTALAKKADVTTAPAKRAAIYKQIEKIWLKESAFAPLVQPQNIVVLHKGVTGYVYSPLDVQGDVRWVKKG
jgi:peptide/nickel transport system substrate-binding protein